MGFIALANMVIALFVSTVVFQAARSLNVPALLNLPGTFCAFGTVISFTGWLQHDLFQSATFMPVPDVPWYAWLEYLGAAIVWYAFVIVLLKTLGKHDQTGEIHTHSN